MASQWHIRQKCGALRQAVVRSVPSSSISATYSVYVHPGKQSYDCTCPGFRFHGRCKHVEAVKADLCVWTSDSPVEQTLQQNVGCVCPACGGETDLDERKVSLDHPALALEAV